ncbi:MAG: hypothetical protein LBG44_01725 [Gemmatimonadota bacterium]|jgi:hypothetical protein|nr:hypothetical protein [Gemmatimonadota bacterium]
MVKSSGRIRGAVLAMATAALFVTPATAPAQGLTFSRGQSIAPAYEGWERNDDGTFNLVFGYMNRNWEETPNVAVGENNFFSPGAPDRGQPTLFLPRRNRFVFKVTVPANFGSQELVWTLKVHGEEVKAYGSLLPEYFLDNVVIMSETGTLGAGTSSPALRSHTPPVLKLETPSQIRARVGEPVRLLAHLSDDGLPARDNRRLPVNENGGLDMALATRSIPSRITVDKIIGLHLTWFVYRAPEGVDAGRTVEFDPPQIHPWEDTRPYSNSPWAPFWVPPELPADGWWTSEVTFSEPGTYILRGRADDGGLLTDEEVTVTVTR